MCACIRSVFALFRVQHVIWGPFSPIVVAPIWEGAGVTLQASIGYRLLARVTEYPGAPPVRPLDNPPADPAVRVQAGSVTTDAPLPNICTQRVFTQEDPNTLYLTFRFSESGQ